MAPRLDWKRGREQMRMVVVIKVGMVLMMMVVKPGVNRKRGNWQETGESYFGFLTPDHPTTTSTNWICFLHLI